MAFGKKGNNVPLLEKTDALGGNCRTYEPDSPESISIPRSLEYHHDNPTPKFYSGCRVLFLLDRCIHMNTQKGLYKRRIHYWHI